MTFTKSVYRYLIVRPERLFWAFVLTHLLMWTVVPSLVSPNLPLDVIEGYAWGNEWLIGTHKHPPMQAWILEIVYTLTGRGRWAPYLTSQIAIVTAFWAVWRTGRRIAGEIPGLVGAMLLEGIVYYNFTSPEFNPNVLQIPFWALAGWSFHKAVKDNKIVDWFLLGLWAAAGLYTKYSTGLFLVVLALAMLAHRDGRKRLATPGPYLAVVVAFLLFLPHLSWLIDNQFLPFTYAEGRMERQPDHYSALISTALLVAGQVVALLFAMLLAVVLYDRRRSPSRAPLASFDRLFLSFAAFGPFIAVLCVSLIFGYHVRDMWVTPFWNFLGLWVVVFLRPSLQPADLRRFALMGTVVFSLGLIVFAANETLAPYVMQKPKRTIFPGKRLSQTIVDIWHTRFNTPLRYVIGDSWPAGNVAWYADDRPHVYMDGNAQFSPWIDQNDLKKSGGVMVWCVSCGSRPSEAVDFATIKATYPNAELQSNLTLNRMTYADVPPAVLGWAIIPPQP